MLTKDERLIDTIVNKTYITQVQWEVCTSPDDLLEANVNNDLSIIMVSDRMFTFEALEGWLKQMRVHSPEVELIVMLSNYHDAARNEQYIQMCSSMQLRTVLPGRGTASIVEVIREQIDGPSPVFNTSRMNSPGNVICFVGSTPNIGTTLISFGTAWSLAQETDGRIGYLCLNLKSSKLHRYLGRDERIFTLDGLRAELKSQSLSRERLLQVCESIPEVPSLKVLYGNMLREQAEFFTPEEIERLLQVAREAFDVCIVDVNAYWDNAATVCSVLQADARVVVTTGDISQFQEDLTKWIGQVGNIFGLEPKSFDLIASLMDKQNHSDHLSIRDIRKETQMYVIGKVHRQSDVVSTLNRGKISELLQSGQPIRNDLHSVTQRFIDKYGLNRRLEGVRVSWFKKLLTGPAAT